MTASTTTAPRRFVPQAAGGRRLARSNYVGLWLRLRAQPMDSYTLAAAASLKPQRCREILWAMVRARTLDVVAWRRRSPMGMWLPVFAPGTGEVAPYPGYLGLRRRAGFSREAQRARTEMVSFGVLMQCLRDGLTLSQIVEATGGSETRIGRCLRMLRDAGAIFVATWERPSGFGRWIPVWELGAGKDAPKPRALTKAEINRRLRGRRKTEAMHAAICGAPGRVAANEAAGRAAA